MGNELELTDLDADGLTLYTDDEGIWVTCTSRDEEVTVGPLDPEALAAWVHRVVPCGPPTVEQRSGVATITGTGHDPLIV